MMALGPRTIDDSLKLGSSDLRFTLSRNDVTDALQAQFFEQGITSVSKFSSFFRDEADLIQVLRDELNLDATASPELEAEMNTREWSKPIPTGDYVQLRSSFIHSNPWCFRRQGNTCKRIFGEEAARVGEW